MRSLIKSFLFIFLLTYCSDSFLEIKPNGSYDEFTLATFEGVEGILFGAYSEVGPEDASYAIPEWVIDESHGVIVQNR